MATQAMGEMMLYPLLLSPTLHTRVWGGRKLETALHKPLPSPKPYGESWEMHDTSTVANGEYAGQTLGGLLGSLGAALIGDASDPAEGFPLLLKFLDAKQWLSVQVHPDDAIAAELEGEPRGKTEAWVVLDADAGAKLALGLRDGLTREDADRSIRDGAAESVLRIVGVASGDVVYLPAGAVHALGPGVLIYEIQQSSDQTYRLYDWGRMGLDGKPRALHIEKGLTATKADLRPTVAKLPTGDGQVFGGPYFETYIHRLQGSTAALDTGSRRFHVLSVIRGAVTIAANGVSVEASLGESVLIPAAVGRYRISGVGDVLRSLQS